MTNYKEKEIIKIVKQMDGEGYTLHDIGQYLDESGYTTKSGKNWNNGNVSTFRSRICKLPSRYIPERGAAISKGRLRAKKQQSQDNAQVNDIELLSKVLKSKAFTDTEKLALIKGINL